MKLNVYVDGEMGPGKVLVTQRPSMAAPSWQTERVEPLIVVLVEERIRLKGEDWVGLMDWAVMREVVRARRVRGVVIECIMMAG